MVRDDPAGRIRSSLQVHIDGARRLWESGEIVEHYWAFVEWRERLARWRSRCGALLIDDFEREAVLEFFGGLQLRDAPEANWHRVMRRDLRALSDMIELLVALQSTLLGRGA